MLSPISEYMHNAQTTLCQRADRADDASEAHGIRDEDDISKTTIPLGWWRSPLKFIAEMIRIVATTSETLLK